MNRSETYKTPQFVISIFGAWLLITGLVSVANRAETFTPILPSGNANVLKVQPGKSQPTSTINNLQSAGGLQGQAGNNLQDPTDTDQLQPNAKQNSF